MRKRLQGNIQKKTVSRDSPDQILTNGAGSLTHHVHILEMNGDSYRLKQSRKKRPAAIAN
ncbi:MAG: hypothetical protein WAK26_00045 [Terracidiphilus sp.]